MVNTTGTMYDDGDGDDDDDRKPIINDTVVESVVNIYNWLNCKAKVVIRSNWNDDWNAKRKCLKWWSIWN